MAYTNSPFIIKYCMDSILLQNFIWILEMFVVCLY